MNWYKNYINSSSQSLYKESINWADIRKGLLMGGLLASPFAVFLISNALRMPINQVQHEVKTNPQGLVQKLDQVIPPQSKTVSQPQTVNQPKTQQQPPTQTTQKQDQQPLAKQNSVVSDEDLIAFIKPHEFNRELDYTVVYDDPKGIPTIGIGLNMRNEKFARKIIESVGGNYDRLMSDYRKNIPSNQKYRLNENQITNIFKQSVQNAHNWARSFDPKLDSRPRNAQLVIGDMAFNMGLPTLSTFAKFKAALDQNRYDIAAQEMQNSRWAKQTGNRARQNIQLMQGIKQ